MIFQSPYLSNRRPQLPRGKIIHHDDLAAQRVVALQLQSFARSNNALVTRFGDAQQFLECFQLARLACFFQPDQQRLTSQSTC